MKKVFMVIAMAFIGVCSLAAQEETQGKEVLCVQSFSYSTSVGTNYVEMVRNKVIEGISKTNRLKLIDAESDPVLKLEQQRRSQETAMHDDNAMLESIKTLGANYALGGHVASITTVRSVDSRGNVTYSSKVAYQLKIYDLSNGTMTSNKTFESASASFLTSHNTQGDAIVSAINMIDSSMKNYVDETFKIEGIVLEISEQKKDEAKSLYINLGTVNGILKGQKLDVFVEREIAGRKATKLIGELKVEAVEGDDLALCKVSKGGKEILKSVNESKKVTVTTKVNNNIFGL